jgi:lipopolysaccharide export system protein LptA
VKLQQYLIVIFFFFTCVALGTISFLGHFNDYGGDVNKKNVGPKFDEVNESYIKKSEYYYLDHGIPFLKMDSDELTLSATNSKIFGFNPSGIVYHDNNPIFFQAKNFQLFLQKKEIILENNVEINFNLTKILSDKVNLYTKDNKVNALGNVKTTSTSDVDGSKILINSDMATGYLKDNHFEYRGHVNGTISRKKLYEKNVSFGTDFLSYLAPQNLVELQGNVVLTKENFKANALRGQIFLENYNKKLKYYALYDDVKIEERVISDGHLLDRKAFAEKLEGIMSEKKVVLTGYPKVFQEKDVIKGNRITIRENTETVEVDDANTSLLLKSEDQE